MAGVRRITGKFAILHIGGVKVGDMQEVTINIKSELEPHSAWEESWTSKEPMQSDWTGSAKRWVSSVASGFMAQAAYASTAAAPSRIVVYSSSGVKVFEGDCWFGGGTLTIPKGLIETDVELEGDGTPIYTTL